MSEFNSLHICKQYSLLVMVLGTYVNVKGLTMWRYECITNGLFGTLATERICSAVLLNCTKARIEPLFELNRTAASVASSNNGMPTFSTPSTQKKIPADCWRAKKNNFASAYSKKKISLWIKVLKKNFRTKTKSPPPPPPPLGSLMVGPLYMSSDFNV